MPAVVETGGEADFRQAGVRLNAHAIGKRQVQNLAAGRDGGKPRCRAETPDDRQVNRAIGRLQNQSAVHHVFDGAGHAGTGDVQRVADIRYLDAHVSVLQMFDDVEILNKGGRHAVRQGRKQFANALGLIAGVKQSFDAFCFHDEPLDSCL